MDAFAEIRQTIEPAVAEYGYEIVRLKWIGADVGKTLQIMVEPTNGGRTDIDTCGEISREVSAILDVEDFIPEKYHLEVTSPGIDRPLTRLKDYERFAGNVLKLEAKLSIEGRKKFGGKIVGVEGEKVILEASADAKREAGRVEIEFENIAEAKLVLTDQLIAEALKKHKEETK